MTPAPYYSGGPLAFVARDFRAHLDAEGRRSWTADARDLRVSARGLSVGSFPPVDFEPRGKRALLIHFGDVFPRSAPTLGRLTPETFALVWGELTGAADVDDVPPARVHTRAGPGGRPRVYNVTPASYGGGGDDAATVVEGVAEAFPDVVASVDYNPETLTTTLTLGFEAYTAVVNIPEDYTDGGVTWRGVDVQGAAVPDPLPHVRPRRRSGAASTIEGLVDKCRAAATTLAPVKWRAHIEDEDATGRRVTLTTDADSEEAAQKIVNAYRRQHRGCVTRIERL